MSNSTAIDLTKLNLEVEGAFCKRVPGELRPAFLKGWQDTLPNKLEPVFPPVQVSGCPRYAYNDLEYNCRFRLAAFPKYVDREFAESLLPDWLELGPAPDAPNGKHPMMFGFGAYEHFGPVLTPWHLRFINYHEFLCSIPETRLKHPGHHYAGPFLYPIKILLDSPAALAVGVLLGYPKHLADIASENLVYQIVRGEKLVCQATVAPAGTPTPAIKTPQPWRVRSSQPIVTSPPTGGHVFTHFEFEMERGFMQPAALDLMVGADDVIPSFLKGSVQIPALVEGKVGAFLLSTPCHWQPPFLRSVLDTINP